MNVRSRSPQSHTPSIDRTVPDLGYVKTNCRVVLHAVNVAMNKWGLDALLPIAEALVSKHAIKRLSA
jgi:hypothetical protein